MREGGASCAQGLRPPPLFREGGGRGGRRGPTRRVRGVEKPETRGEEQLDPPLLFLLEVFKCEWRLRASFADRLKLKRVIRTQRLFTYSQCNKRLIKNPKLRGIKSEADCIHL